MGIPLESVKGDSVSPSEKLVLPKTPKGQRQKKNIGKNEIELKNN